MKEYIVKIRLSAEDADDVKRIGGLIQHAVNVVAKEDLAKLLEAVRRNPGVVKTALNFL